MLRLESTALLRVVRELVRVRPRVLALVLPESRPVPLREPPPLTPPLPPTELRVERPREHSVLPLFKELFDRLLARPPQMARVVPVEYSLLAY